MLKVFSNQNNFFTSSIILSEQIFLWKALKMSIPKFRFNIISVIELIIIIIMIPVCCSTWIGAVANWRYYFSIKNVVAYYNVQYYAEMEAALSKAEQALPEDVTLQLFRANYFIEQKKYDKALTIYEHLVKNKYDNTALPKIGLLVCKLQQIQQETNTLVLLQTYSNLEDEATKIYKEHNNASDALILLAHIMLKKSQCLQQSNKNSSNAVQIEDMAWQKLQEVQKRTEEQAQMIATSDVDKDGKISLSEWKGKNDLFYQIDWNHDFLLDRNELLTIWMPPSYHSIHSMYLAQAWINWQRAQRLVEAVADKYIEPNSPEAITIVANFESAIHSLQSALMLRAYNPTLASNISYLYGSLLSLPFIPDKQRRQFLAEAKNYRANLKQYQDDLISHNRKKAELNNLFANSPIFFFGESMGNYYVDDFATAQESLSQVDFSIDPERLTRMKVQIKLAQLDRELLQPGKLEYYNPSESTNASIVDYYEQAIKSLPNDQPLNIEQFTAVNNSAVLSYMNFKGTKNRNELLKAQKLLEKYQRVSNITLMAKNIEYSVTAKQILNHNFYMIMLEVDPKKAGMFSKNCLPPTRNK